VTGHPLDHYAVILRACTSSTTVTAAAETKEKPITIGGALATLFLVWGVQNLAAALLCGMASAGAAGIPGGAGLPGVVPWLRKRPEPAGDPGESPGPAGPRSSSTGWLRAGGVAAGVLLLVALGASTALDRRLTRWTHPDLAAARDTPYGRVTITRSRGLVAVFENDALAWESQGTAAEEFVHLAALETPAPRSVLRWAVPLARSLVVWWDSWPVRHMDRAGEPSNEHVGTSKRIRPQLSSCYGVCRDCY